LAWDDRDVARALFEAIRPRLEQIDDHEIGLTGQPMLLGWSFFDPRAMAAWLEKLPLPAQFKIADDYARLMVADSLGLPHDRRSERFWHYWTEMRELFDRDLR
jgi:hypothetical protein